MVLGVDGFREGEEASMGFGEGLLPDGMVLRGGLAALEAGSLLAKESLAGGLSGGEEGVDGDGSGGMRVGRPEVGNWKATC